MFNEHINPDFPSIKIPIIDPPRVKVFWPNKTDENKPGSMIGYLNEYEFAELRAQIAEKKVKGFKIQFGEKFIDIEVNGGLGDNCPSIIF